MTCVYVHYLADLGVPFYVGSGESSRARASGGGRNTIYNMMEAWYGSTKEIVVEDVSRETALSIERDLIIELSAEYPQYITNTIHATNKKLPLILSADGRFFVDSDLCDIRRVRQSSLIAAVKRNHTLVLVNNLNEYNSATNDRTEVPLDHVFGSNIKAAIELDKELKLYVKVIDGVATYTFSTNPIDAQFYGCADSLTKPEIQFLNECTKPFRDCDYYVMDIVLSHVVLINKTGYRQLNDRAIAFINTNKQWLAKQPRYFDF